MMLMRMPKWTAMYYGCFGPSSEFLRKPARSLDVFLKRFRSAVQTLELAGSIEVLLPMLKNVGLLDYTKAETETDATKQTEMKK
eukprot:7533070-Ditylum_brightwellii.AAC.1